MCRRDGHWFLKLLQAETGRMEGWCQQMDLEVQEHQLSEEGKTASRETGRPLGSWVEGPHDHTHTHTYSMLAYRI